MPPPRGHLLDWRLSSVLLVCAIWTALVLMSVANGVLLARLDGREVVLARLLPARAIDWYSCAVFTPIFVWFARRCPLERATLARALPLWVLLVALAAPAKFLLQYVASQWLQPGAIPLSLGALIMVGFIPEVIAFGAMAAVILSVEYHDRWRERERQAGQLSRQLSEARLEALTAQLQPHFLFNTLQGISTLLYRDTVSADRMLGRLSELLRRTLQAADAPEVPLEQELCTLSHYLEIQRIRFQDRLHVEVQAKAPGDALVPHLVLQPLVENAIRHGIERRAGEGRVRVATEVIAGRLVLVVHDGCATPPLEPVASSTGIGLANTRARLQTLYGDDASLRIEQPPSGGFTVRLTLPLRRAGAAVA